MDAGQTSPGGIGFVGGKPVVRERRSERGEKGMGIDHYIYKRRDFYGYLLCFFPIGAWWWMFFEKHVAAGRFGIFINEDHDAFLVAVGHL